MSIRSTLLTCTTALACIAVLMAYVHKNTRYDMVSGQDGVYVLDRQTTLMHHCDKKKCKLLSPEGSSVEAMRALSGAPSVNLVRQKPPVTCVVPEKKPEINYQNVNVSSFQSIVQPMPSMNDIKGNTGDALGMEQVSQQVQKPKNPFSKKNTGAPAPQSKAKPVPSRSTPQEESPAYGDAPAAENDPSVEALENRYGAAAAGNADSSYPSGGGSGASGNADSSYPSGGGSGASGNADSSYPSGGGSGASGNADSSYPSGGGSGASGNADSSYPSGGDSGASGDGDSSYPSGGGSGASGDGDSSYPSGGDSGASGDGDSSYPS